MDTHKLAPLHEPRLLDRVRDKIRLKHYSIRTEHAYVDWVRTFALFHGKRHPAKIGAPEVEAFLTHGRCPPQRRSIYAESGKERVTLPCFHVHQNVGKF